MFHRWLYRCLALVLAVGSLTLAQANPVQTTPSTYGSAVVQSTLTFVEYNGDVFNGAGGWKVHIEATWSGSEPVNATGNVRVYGSTGPYIIDDASMSRDGSHTLSITSTNYALAGSTISHGVYVGYNGAFYVNTETLDVPAAGAYKVTFNIPANDTQGVIHYSFYQNGTKINEYTSGKGDPASSVTLTGLETADVVTMVRVQYEYAWITVGNETQLQATGANIVAVVSSGTPTHGGSTAPTPENPPATPIVQNPTAPVPVPAAPTPTPPPAAPTPTTPITINTPIPVPYPVPTGTGGATKEDLQTQTNDLITGLNFVAKQVNDSANGVVAAVNNATTQSHTNATAIVTAINNANAKTVEGHTAIVTGLNNAQKTLDRMDGRLVSIATNTQATVTGLANVKTTLEERLGPRTTDAQTAATEATNSASNAGTTASSAAAALFNSNAAPTTTPASLTSETAILAVTMPAAFGGKTFDMNPFSSDRFASICSWFRAATAWLALVTLGVWVWLQIKGWLGMFAGSQQARGNTIAGTGGQATAFIAAGIMTAFIVTAITALLAWSFGDISLPAIRTVAMSNPLSAMPAQAAWMLDQLFPVATLVSCLIARFSFNLYAAPLFAACQAAVRFVVP